MKYFPLKPFVVAGIDWRSLSDILKSFVSVKHISLGKRLLFTATLTLVVFLGLAGLALDRAFVSSTKVSIKNELIAQVHALLSAIELNERGELVVPAQLPESRLASPASRLYALILSSDENILWRSGSSLGVTFDDLRGVEPGEGSFYQMGGNPKGHFYYKFGIAWEMEGGDVHRFTLVIVNESFRYLEIINSHRQVLLFWLGLVALFLLVFQGLAVRWSLIPLSRVAEELDRIEHAQQDKIIGEYPPEISQLSGRINLFIENERRNLIRYRNTLGDLAHSLKTPLAVIKNGLAHNKDTAFATEHIDRMNRIIEYQLKRASSSELSLSAQIVDVNAVMKRIRATLDKVYESKCVDSEWRLSDSATFYGDEDDLYEVVGNVMDNAFKWSADKVFFETTVLNVDGQARSGVAISVEDDGPGIPMEQYHMVLKRGGRIDENYAGQGLGLSVAKEVIERYRGEISISRSKMGGAKVVISVPPYVAGKKQKTHSPTLRENECESRSD